MPKIKPLNPTPSEGCRPGAQASGRLVAEVSMPLTTLRQRLYLDCRRCSSTPSRRLTTKFRRGVTAAADHTAKSASAPSSRSSRFVLLAASVSIAAAIGSFAATLAAVGYRAQQHRFVASASSSEPSSRRCRSCQGQIESENKLAQLNTMKSSLDSATHYANAQLNSISERLEKVEHAQTDPAQLAHISDSIDRLNKSNTTAPETTGSITPPAQTATAGGACSRRTEDHRPHTGRLGAGRCARRARSGCQPLRRRIFGDARQRAPQALGHVDAVKRQDGKWVVVTGRGLITGD